jgi:hypothetical protein
VCAITRLTRLDLHSNLMEALPAEVGQLQRVKHMSLHFNKLKVGCAVA